MNANDITFGVELETTMAIETVARERMNIGSYHNGVQVPFLPVGWKAERDSSIQAPAGHIGCEFISPVLKGEKGIKQVIEVVRILRERGGSEPIYKSTRSRRI